MPAPNEERRALLADTAITLLATEGARGLTHRAVERAAGLPTGTASNYFPSREALFAAAARRIVALHAADMDTVVDDTPAAGRRSERGLAELLGRSLLDASTRDRDRYLAVFELQAESLRRPSLTPVLREMQQALLAFTLDHHRRLGVVVPRHRVPLLMELYGSVLHSLVLRPPGTVDRAVVTPLARALVRGALT